MKTKNMLIASGLMLVSAPVFSQSIAYICEACEEGTFSDGEICTPCKAGTYAHTAATECKTCPKGKYSGDKAGECSDCIKNTEKNYIEYWDVSKNANYTSCENSAGAEFDSIVESCRKQFPSYASSDVCKNFSSRASRQACEEKYASCARNCPTVTNKIVSFFGSSTTTTGPDQNCIRNCEDSARDAGHHYYDYDYSSPFGSSSSENNTYTPSTFGCCVLSALAGRQSNSNSGTSFNYNCHYDRSKDGYYMRVETGSTWGIGESKMIPCHPTCYKYGEGDYRYYNEKTYRNETCPTSWLTTEQKFDEYTKDVKCVSGVFCTSDVSNTLSNLRYGKSNGKSNSDITNAFSNYCLNGNYNSNIEKNISGYKNSYVEQICGGNYLNYDFKKEKKYNPQCGQTYKEITEYCTKPGSKTKDANINVSFVKDIVMACDAHSSCLYYTTKDRIGTCGGCSKPSNSHWTSSQGCDWGCDNGYTYRRDYSTVCCSTPLPTNGKASEVNNSCDWTCSNETSHVTSFDHSTCTVKSCASDYKLKDNYCNKGYYNKYYFTMGKSKTMLTRAECDALRKETYPGLKFNEFCSEW